MKLIDKLSNIFSRQKTSIHTDDFLFSAALVEHINNTGSLNILNWSSLRLYDGPVPKSPSSKLIMDNNLVWEWKGIQNESKVENEFLFTNKSALVLYDKDDKVRVYKPTFFRLSACRDYVVQGIVSNKCCNGITLSNEYLFSGMELRLDVFSLKVPKNETLDRHRI